MTETSPVLNACQEHTAEFKKGGFGGIQASRGTSLAPTSKLLYRLNSRQAASTNYKPGPPMDASSCPVSLSIAFATVGVRDIRGKLPAQASAEDYDYDRFTIVQYS